jgi:hypothetical protein
MSTRKRPDPKAAIQPPSGLESPHTNADQERRLELLKKQREAERLENERALWLDASKLPGVPSVESIVQNTTQGLAKQPPKRVSGLFAKLKLGRFLE